MHGLINKALESFLGDTYGQTAWQEIQRAAGLWEQSGSDGFDSLQIYPDAVTYDLLASATAILGRTQETLLEDMGTYLVSHQRTERLRRLLRFGGRSYTDFLRSLDDLQGRARLAVPDFELPLLTLEETGPGRFCLHCHRCPPGFGTVMLGILRAMGDDYGALVVLEAIPATIPAAIPVRSLARTGNHPSRPVAGALTAPVAATGEECLMIAVHDPAFHQGRQFELAGSDTARAGAT